jgi:hypothetical protein
MHIDMDYYDYIDEQADKKRRLRRRGVVWMRAVMLLFMAVMFACGIISLFQSCA